MTNHSSERDAAHVVDDLLPPLFVETIAEAMYDANAQATTDQWLMWSHVTQEVRDYWLSQADPYLRTLKQDRS